MVTGVHESRSPTRVSPTSDIETSTALLIFPAEWLPRRADEWGPLAKAAVEAGFRAVVADWDSLDVVDGRVIASECILRYAPHVEPTAASRIVFDPGVVLTTWGVDWGHRELFEDILSCNECHHSEASLLAWLDGKRELEQCLRVYEDTTGLAVPRPRTLLSEEISVVEDTARFDQVIVKPSRSGQCKGIEIVPRAALSLRAAEVARGAREPFVAQELVDDVFLYEGRRWDLRVHAMATSLDPLRYRLYPDGIAKLAGATANPGSSRLDEWLNAESFLDDDRYAMPLSEMLSYVASTYGPLSRFWERLDELVGRVFASIARAQVEHGTNDERCFLFPGFDLIVERGPGHDYELRLLEINSHPGLGWNPSIAGALAPGYRQWFRDLLGLVRDAARPPPHKRPA